MTKHHERQLAGFALHFRPPKRPNGTAPSDEELTALYENRLPNARRTDVLSHIANDAAVYRRWLSCVQNQTLVETLTNTQATAVTSPTRATSERAKKRGGWLGIIHFLSSRTGFWGSGAAAVVTVLLMVFIIPFDSMRDDADPLARAFADWPSSLKQYWQQSPYSTLPTQLPPRAIHLPPSIIQQIVATGFRQGMLDLPPQVFASQGWDANKIPVITYTPALKLDPTQFKRLIDLGHFSALATVQCKLDPHHLRLKNIHAPFSALVQELQKLGVSELGNLQTALLSQADVGAAVCAATTATVQLVRGSVQ